MSKRQQRILEEVRAAGRFGISYYSLAYRTGYPDASIRRDVQVLRRLGHRISTPTWSGKPSPGGWMRLEAATA